MLKTTFIALTTVIICSGTANASFREFTTFSYAQLVPSKDYVLDLKTRVGARNQTTGANNERGEDSFYSLGVVYKFSDYIQAGLEYDQAAVEQQDLELFAQDLPDGADNFLSHSQNYRSHLTGLLGLRVPLAKGKLLFAYSGTQIEAKRESEKQFFTGTTLLARTEQSRSDQLFRHQFSLAYRQGIGMIGLDFVPAQRIDAEDLIAEARRIMVYVNANVMSNFQLGLSVSQIRFNSQDETALVQHKDHQTYRLAGLYYLGNKIMGLELNHREQALLGVDSYFDGEAKVYLGIKASRDMEVGASFRYVEQSYSQQQQTLAARTTGIGLEARLNL